MATLTKDEPLSAKLKAEAARHGGGDADAGLAKRDRKDLVSLVSGDKSLARAQADELFEEYSRAFDKVTKRENLVDAGSEMSFPASDPPSYMAGASVAGAPDSKTPAEKPNTKVSDPAEVKSATEAKPQAGDDDSNTNSAASRKR